VSFSIVYHSVLWFSLQGSKCLFVCFSCKIEICYFLTHEILRIIQFAQEIWCFINYIYILANMKTKMKVGGVIFLWQSVTLGFLIKWEIMWLSFSIQLKMVIICVLNCVMHLYIINVHVLPVTGRNTIASAMKMGVFVTNYIFFSFLNWNKVGRL
jgi:hypothetical protein